MSRDPLDPPTIDEDYDARVEFAEAFIEAVEGDPCTVTGRFVAVTMEASSEKTALLSVEVSLAQARAVGHLLNCNAVLSVIDE